MMRAKLFVPNRLSDQGAQNFLSNRAFQLQIETFCFQRIFLVWC